jgi:hypothetical protein
MAARGEQGEMIIHAAHSLKNTPPPELFQFLPQFSFDVGSSMFGLFNGSQFSKIPSALELDS